MLDADQCVCRLGSAESGLSEPDADSRLERYGANALPHARPPGAVKLFLSQFRSPLIYLLLGAAIISAIVGHGSDAAFILGVLVLNAVIGAVQEGRAGASAEALRSMIRQHARVRRDGKLAERDAAILVPGDIVIVESGDRVPGDIRLLRAINLHADESLLTGEAMPVVKDAAITLDADTRAADRRNMLHAGTTITSGRATGIVVATGSATELGRIDLSLREVASEPLPLMRDLARLSRQVAVGTVVLLALLAVALAAKGSGIEEILMLAIALAVATIPEGLPIAVTIALAAATRRMARRNVIVRTLPAVEGLGACTLIATDKTGTLTQNRLTVELLLTDEGRTVAEADWDRPEHAATVTALAHAARQCNEAGATEDGDFIGDSVDVALLRFAAMFDLPGEDGEERIELFAYEPVNRFASVAVRRGDGVEVIAKGAVETIAAMCDQVAPDLLAATEEVARQGYRVLAFAHGCAADAGAANLAHPSGLRMIGCTALLDPLRPEAMEAIAHCRSAGIEVRMLTGDHPATAHTIGVRLGLADGGDGVVTGAELDALSKDERAFADMVVRSRVFARIEPAQKLQIVRILQQSGHTVAVTGDGVNDAPALQAADIGVAMGSGGTDVAREAADLILTDDNFASIVSGIEEGRAAYANLRRIAIFLIGTGMAEISMFVGALAMGLPAPLTPVQILWANLVTETAQNVGLALAGAEGDELERPPRSRKSSMIDGNALAQMLVPAAAMMLVTVALFGWWFEGSGSLYDSRSLALLTVVLFQNVFVLAVSSERRSILRFSPRRNRWLVAGVGVALGLHLLAMSFPATRGILGLAMPNMVEIAACLGGAVIVLVAVEITKAVLRQRRSTGPSASTAAE
ncbi:cation-translocating P-type ATPase [Stakelama marina]|nr:cation-transporting P-type ATPase [Stakelama marina]